MATAPSTPQKTQNPGLPPKRGRIKAQIFQSLIGSVSSLTSKAGEALGKIKEIGAGGGGGSASTTPPASADTSDGYSDHA